MTLLSSKFVPRLWLTAIVMVATFGLSLVLVYRMGSVEIGPLRNSLHELPVEMGPFTGVDRELDPMVARRVGALDSISRVYSDPLTGTDISLHVASFTALGEPSLPHPPAMCYRLSGAEIIGQRPVTVGAGEPITAQLMTVERAGARSYVIYWYFWGDYVCSTRSQAMLTRLKMVGRRQWPPLVKVLLEVPHGRSSDESLQALTDFAAEVRNFTQTL